MTTPALSFPRVSELICLQSITKSSAPRVVECAMTGSAKRDRVGERCISVNRRRTRRSSERSSFEWIRNDYSADEVRLTRVRRLRAAAGSILFLAGLGDLVRLSHPDGHGDGGHRKQRRNNGTCDRQYGPLHKRNSKCGRRRSCGTTRGLRGRLAAFRRRAGPGATLRFGPRSSAD
jgi:hypothetical protein